MSPSEVLDRSVDHARRRIWVLRQPRNPRSKSVSGRLPFKTVPGLTAELCAANPSSTVQQADQLLNGQWKVFNVDRTDVNASVDYYIDPTTGRSAPSDVHAFRIDHRNESSIGNVKNIWELARHQHLTILAAAYATTKDSRYATRVADELTNYLQATPFCRGIHWTSGIEIGIRMISWVWVRRLLADWPQANELFEDNPVFTEHLGRHHQWINAFPAKGSSANNHLIAESCGTFIAANAFDIFERREQWRDQAASTLIKEFKQQTFNDGLNKELASDYHGFVLELVTAAYVEARLSRHPMADEVLPTLTKAFDALASIVDCNGDAHHQGDADQGRGLLLEASQFNRWPSLLASGAAIVKPASWWPEIAKTDLRTEAFRACVNDRSSSSTSRVTAERGQRRSSHFTDAGQTILRDIEPRPDEIWVRFDHGPHGYLSTAAHAHADSLSIEIRVGGIPIIVDPGTYCYHGEPEWRDYFRSTAAHSTVEVNGENQSQIQGPFLWGNHCSATFETCEGLDNGDIATCSANHQGYEARFGVVHRRNVSLNRRQRSITICDELVGTGTQPSTIARVMFHFHPNITLHQLATTSSPTILIEGFSINNHRQAHHADQAKLDLDPSLSWSLSKGKTEPPLGWYSHILGHREPCWVLVGETQVEAKSSFSTTLTF